MRYAKASIVQPLCHARLMAVGVMIVAVVVGGGCGINAYSFCGLHGFTLIGKLVDAQTLEPVSFSVDGVWFFDLTLLADGHTSQLISGMEKVALPNEDGVFTACFPAVWQDISRVPVFIPASSDVPEPTMPDQIRIVVSREECQQSFLIDINENTVVGLDFPRDVIELRDPLLLTPCGQ